MKYEDTPRIKWSPNDFSTYNAYLHVWYDNNSKLMYSNMYYEARTIFLLETQWKIKNEKSILDTTIPTDHKVYIYIPEERRWLSARPFQTAIVSSFVKMPTSDNIRYSDNDWPNTTQYIASWFKEYVLLYRTKWKHRIMGIIHDSVPQDPFPHIPIDIPLTILDDGVYHGNNRLDYYNLEIPMPSLSSIGVQ